MKITKGAFNKARKELIEDLGTKNIKNSIVEQSYLIFLSGIDNYSIPTSNSWIKKSTNFKEYFENIKKFGYSFDSAETVEHFCDVWFNKLMSSENFFNGYLKKLNWKESYLHRDIIHDYATCKKLNVSTSEIYDFLTERYYDSYSYYAVVPITICITYEMCQLDLSDREIEKNFTFVAYNYEAISKVFFKKMLPYIIMFNYRISFLKKFKVQMYCKEQFEFPEVLEGLTEEEIEKYLHI